MSSSADSTFLSRLLDEHGDALSLYAAQWTDAADDCVQEAILELVRRPTLPDNVPAWLFRVVRNMAVNEARKSERRKKHETRAGTERGVSRDQLVGQFSPVDVCDALPALDEETREVVILRVWGNLSFEAIAELGGISSSTAHRRYVAGLQLLREKLGVTWITTKT